MNWCHGTYELLPNGSIYMIPFGDGFQQIQDACAAVSNFIEDYNDTEIYQSWSIFQDPILGYQLQLYQFDGTPLAQQNLVTTSPNMLPTRSLRNTTGTIANSDLAVSAGARTRHGWSVSSIVGLTSAVMAVGAGSLFL